MRAERDYGDASGGVGVLTADAKGEVAGSAERCHWCGRPLSRAEAAVGVDYCSVECASAVPGGYTG
jgi:hypothetical protein